MTSLRMHHALCLMSVAFVLHVLLVSDKVKVMAADDDCDRFVKEGCEEKPNKKGWCKQNSGKVNCSKEKNKAQQTEEKNTEPQNEGKVPQQKEEETEVKKPEQIEEKNPEPPNEVKKPEQIEEKKPEPQNEEKVLHQKEEETEVKKPEQIEEKKPEPQNDVRQPEQIVIEDEQHHAQIEKLEKHLHEMKETQEKLKENLDHMDEEIKHLEGQGLDPCDPDNHVIDSESWRSTKEVVRPNESGQIADRCETNQTSGFYRFLLHGKNAIIPTECVERPKVPDGILTCSTYLPLWLDLEGADMPQHDREETWARVRGSWAGNCKAYTGSVVKIRRCNGFYVYHLDFHIDGLEGQCLYAFCTIPE